MGILDLSEELTTLEYKATVLGEYQLILGQKISEIPHNLKPKK